MTSRTPQHPRPVVPLSRIGIQEPLTPALAQVLRRAVVEHVGSVRGRDVPAVLHAGFPGGDRRSLELDPAWTLDPTLRVEMIEAITRAHLAAGKVPLVWLTRGGAPATTSDDLLWSAATRAAGSELGVALDLVVVTSRSWRDPRSGAGRTWLRPRSLRTSA